MKVKETKKYTFLIWDQGEDYYKKCEDIKQYLKSHYGANFDYYSNKIKTNSVSIGCDIRKVNSPGTSIKSSYEKIKVKLYKGDYYYKKDSKSESTYVAENHIGTLKISEVIRIIDNFAEAKKKEESEQKLLAKEREFKRMIEKGKLCKLVGLELIDADNYGSRYRVKNVDKEKGFIGIDNHDKVNNTVDVTINITIETSSYNEMKVSIDPLNVKKLIESLQDVELL